MQPGTRKRVVRWTGLGLLAAFLAIQAVPYGRDHANPPIAAEPAWDSPRTRELFLRACGDCHSHETVWPWYSHVAPMSWVVQRDVDDGRRHFNVSAWGPHQRHGDDAADELAAGTMPLPMYLLLHPEARLDPAGKAELIGGLEATFGHGRGEAPAVPHDHDHDHGAEGDTH